MPDYQQAPFNKIRKDKFIMSLSIPKGLKGITSNVDYLNSEMNPNAFQMSLYGCTIPPIIVPEITAPYGGQSIKVSSYARPPWPPLTINFTIDNRFNNYWFIYKWLDILNDDLESIYDAENVTNETNIPAGDLPNVGTYSQALQYYSTTISIYALDEYEKQTMEFKFIGAFPTNLGGINYNYRDATEAETTAEFAYSQFKACLVEQVNNL